MPGIPPPRYAYLGPAGTFTEAALRTIPAARRAELLPMPSVAAALDSVRDAEVEAALVPFENSVEGSVAAALDDLATGEPLQITREVVLPVAFSLLARRGLEQAAVRTVATHPHAEAQCRRWLRAVLPAAQVVPSPSTADAARSVRDGVYDAALSAPIAAKEYDLAVLAADVHDRPGAVTRFVLVGRPGVPPAPTGADRTTLVAYLGDDRPGALLELLSEFAVRGVNLTRIESRPTGDGLGRYCFSLDCDGHIAQARVGEALMAVRRLCAEVRFLGSYPRADDAVAPERPATSDADFRDAASWLARLRDGRT